MALAWLRSAEPDVRTLGEMATTAEAIALVVAPLSTAVAKVIAVEIEAVTENTGRLVLEMPAHPATRATAFAWAARIAEEQGFHGEIDTGQWHLFVMLD